MSQTQETTLAELVAQAIEKLPPFKRRVAQIRMRSKKYREAVYAEVGEKLANDDACPFCATIQAEGFTEATTFGIDIDKLDQILALILKYLPSILELVLKFLTIAIAFIGLSVLMAGSSMAQTCWVDAYGRKVCEAPRMNRAEAPVIAPIVNALQVALPPYVPVVRQEDMYRIGCEVPLAAAPLIREEFTVTYEEPVVFTYHRAPIRSLVYRAPIRKVFGRILSRLRGN